MRHAILVILAATAAAIAGSYLVNWEYGDPARYLVERDAMAAKP